MKKLLLFLTLVLNILLNAQDFKTNDFRLIDYDIETDNTVSIISFSTIDKNGILKVYIKGYNDENDYYSYKLKKNEIEKINRVFSKRLNDYIIKKQFEQNTYYAGSRSFINFKNKKNNEKLCFIAPFMSNEFNETFNFLNNKIYKQSSSNKISQFKIDFNKIKKEILQQEVIDNYLPQKKLPPPPMRKSNPN